MDLLFDDDEIDMKQASKFINSKENAKKKSKLSN